MQIEKLGTVAYWSKNEGRVAVDAWRRSGLTKDAFEQRYGIAAQRIRYWSKRIPSSTSGRSEIALAPVTVLASPVSEIALELRASGHVVRLRGDVDEDQLARVIRVAERAGC